MSSYIFFLLDLLFFSLVLHSSWIQVEKKGILKKKYD